MIDNGVRQSCIMSLSLCNVYMDSVMKRGENGDGEDGLEISGGGE